MLHEHRFTDSNSLLEALTQRCINLIRLAEAASPAQTLFLSGGSTPRPLYERLAAAHLPWNTIQIALVDERWVPLTHEASNEAMLCGAFHPALEQGLTITGMFDGNNTPEEAIAHANEKYRRLARPWSLALVGMGNDGHTASLFPQALGMEHALGTQDICVPITAKPSLVTGPYLQRMSLGLQALLSNEQLILLITGQAKWEVYRQALNSATPANTPVSYLLQQQQTPIDVYWCP